jgi:energy-coupling factor transport system ATP-binding protein
LDEPTGGLDPRGKQEILALIKSLKEECSPTVIMINHDMDEVAENADKAAVLENGRIVMTGTPREIFKDEARLLELGLGVPKVCELRQRLRSHGVFVKDDALTEDELAEEILKVRKRL